MVSVYTVKDDEGEYGSYLCPLSVQGHFDSIKARFPKESEKLHLRIESNEIDHIVDQLVVIEGRVVGYQFARIKMGTRKLHRSVSHLRQNEQGFTIGEIEFDGSLYTMAYDRVLNRWYHFDSTAV